MKGMKGKLMKKIKSANKPISGYLNSDRILQVSNNFDGFVDNFKFKPNFVDKFHFKSPQTNPKLEKPKKIEEEEEEEQEVDKENIYPSFCEENEKDDFLDLDVCSFRRPDLDSMSLFDPKLLAAFERAVSEHVRVCDATEVACDKKEKYPFFQPEEKSDPLSEPEDQLDPLLEFDEKCPPGGTDSVIFYTTTLRGIRKTFEDCQSIRFLLDSFGVIYYERDVSLHCEYRDELWRVMGARVLPPRLFIRGRYIGGADKVSTLHEQGKLRVLFRDIPIDFSDGPCNVCCGLRFMLCYNCNGSRKLFKIGDNDSSSSHSSSSSDGVWIKCLQCNENGLVVCPLC